MNRFATQSLSAAVAMATALVGWSVTGWWKDADHAVTDVTEAGPSKPKPVSSTSGSSLVAAMAAVETSGDPAAQMEAAVDLASRLDPRDFGEFLDNLRLLPAHAAQGLASRAVLRRWVAHDPTAALHWCVARDPNLVAGVLDEWARQTPPDQLAQFLDQVPAGQRAQAIPSVFNALASSDPEAAMQFLSQPITAESIHRLDRALRHLANQDPDWLLKRAESLPDHVQAQARKAVAQSMAETDAAEAAAWAAAQPDRSELLRSLADRKDADPSLIAAIASLPHEEQSGMYLPMYNWDPTRAPAMIDAIVAHRDQFGNSMLRNLLEGAANYAVRADDPGALANQLLALGTESSFDVNGFASQWAQRSPEAARAWAASLADETQRRDALTAIDTTVNPPTENLGPSSAEKLAQAFTRGNPQEIHRLLAVGEAERLQALDAGFSQMLQPADSARDFSRSSWRQMTLRYPAEAAQWLSKNVETENFEKWSQPLTTTAAAWAAESPRAAAEWAAALPPGETRAWAAANVIGQWKRFDEPAARAFLETLPEAERAIASKGFAPMPRPR